MGRLKKKKTQKIRKKTKKIDFQCQLSEFWRPNRISSQFYRRNLHRWPLSTILIAKRSRPVIKTQKKREETRKGAKLAKKNEGSSKKCRIIDLLIFYWSVILHSTFLNSSSLRRLVSQNDLKMFTWFKNLTGISMIESVWVGWLGSVSLVRVSLVHDCRLY